MLANCKNHFGAMASIVVLLGLASHVAAQEKEKPDKRDAQAKEVAEQFMKALMKGEGIDAVMKNVDVPFFFDARGIIKESEQVKKVLEPLLAQAKTPPTPEFKVCAISSFGSLPDDVLTGGDQKRLKDILDKNDRIVLFHFPKGNEVMAIAVRFKDEKAKIVGVRAHVEPISWWMVAADQEKGNEATKKARATAKETAEKFIKAAKDEDLDSLAKLTDTPWYFDGAVIKDKDGLKKQLKILVNNLKERAKEGRKPSGNVILIVSQGTIRDAWQSPKREAAAQVFAIDDWVVLMGEGREQMLVIVRVREGKGKIIGMGD